MANSRKLSSIDAATDVLVASVVCCLKRHLLPTQHLAVGLSGGIDSVCLLHVLATKVDTEQFPFRLSAIHVNHGLSPNADRWESFCRAYCDSLKIPCVAKHVTVARKSRDGLEGAARRARHEVFAETSADWVMLAHQRDDQAETLLFNLLRGTGIAGAAAMRERKAYLLRPLLSIGREVIERYVGLHGLEWCEDESNRDIHHSRNFLRQRVFPELIGRFPAAASNLANAAARFAEVNNLIDDLARQDLAPGNDHFPVSVNSLHALDEIRGRNVLRYLLAKNQVQIPSEARLREALRQMIDAAADRHPVLTFGQHRLLRRRGWIYLELINERTDSN